MRRTSILATIATATLVMLGSVGSGSPAAHAATVTTTKVDGSLQAGFATAAPCALQVLTPNRGMVTVNVGPTTTIVRRYNAASSLDELAAGDRLQIVGEWTAANVMSATRIKDNSIQHAFSHSIGMVTSISDGGMTMTMLILRGESFAPFRKGQLIALKLLPNTMVTLSDGSAFTAANGGASYLEVGAPIASVGVFDRSYTSSSARTLTAWRIRVLTPAPGQTGVIFGILKQTAVSATAPTTLTVETAAHQVITVNVSSTTTISREQPQSVNLPQTLSELKAGAALAISGTYLGKWVYNATTIIDASR